MVLEHRNKTKKFPGEFSNAKQVFIYWLLALEKGYLDLPGVWHLSLHLREQLEALVDLLNIKA